MRYERKPTNRRRDDKWSRFPRGWSRAGVLVPRGRKWSAMAATPDRSLTLIKDDFFLVLAQLQKLHGVLQLLFLFK